MVKIMIAESAERKIWESRIDIGELERVITFSEKSGKYLLDPENDHRFSHLSMDHVTYWVEYLPIEDGSFLVCNAYFHRMSIVEKDIRRC